MAFLLSEFKSHLTGGGAKSALFQVNLSYPALVPSIAPPTNAKFLISAASIPGSTVGTYDVFYHGKSIKVAADKTSTDAWETTIINDEDFGVRKSLEKWMSLLGKHELNTRSKDLTGSKEGENASYKQDISVTQFSKNGKPLETYQFIGAFPTALSTIALGWDSSTIETYTCSWSYDRWKRL